MNENFKNVTPNGMRVSQEAFAATSEKLQTFGKEITEMSRESYERTVATMEKMSKAKTFEELMSIQKSFVTEALQAATDRTRKIGEMMTSLPMEMTKAYQDAISKATGEAKGANQATHGIINH